MKLQNERSADCRADPRTGAAAQAMRRLLVDHGRHQKREKRGGGAQPVVLDELLKAASHGRRAGRGLLTLERR